MWLKPNTHSLLFPLPLFDLKQKQILFVIFDDNVVIIICHLCEDCLHLKHFLLIHHNQQSKGDNLQLCVH